MPQVKLPKPLKCQRCGHTWMPRQTEIIRCPKCSSPYWNRPLRPRAQEAGR